MAFLQVGATTVPVAPGGASAQYQTIGPGGSRQFDGSILWDERAMKREWDIRTASMLPADADALVTALGTGAAVSCTGDMFSNGGAAVTCFRRLNRRIPVVVRGGHRVVLDFTLLES